MLTTTGPLPCEAAVRPGSLLDRLADIDLSGTGWMDRALCAEVGIDLHYPEKGEPVTLARRVCMACEVRAECLTYALEHSAGAYDVGRYGIWGGLTPSARDRLRKESREQTRKRRAA